MNKPEPKPSSQNLLTWHPSVLRNLKLLFMPTLLFLFQQLTTGLLFQKGYFNMQLVPWVCVSIIAKNQRAYRRQEEELYWYWGWVSREMWETEFFMVWPKYFKMMASVITLKKADTADLASLALLLGRGAPPFTFRIYCWLRGMLQSINKWWVRLMIIPFQVKATSHWFPHPWWMAVFQIASAV